MPEDNQTTPMSVRVKVSTLLEMNKEIEGTNKTLPDFVREAIEEKLTNDNKEILEQELKKAEWIVKALKNKKKNFVEKEKIIQRIPEKEISFFLDTKKVIEQNPQFIQGRINLYKNKFNKNHLRISIQEFLQMIEGANNQHQEEQILKQNA